MNVEERKQQGRTFEQHGETAKALGLYEEILSELEGTPAIWRELPLYVRAGDLSLKTGDAGAAIAHYEKAATAYAVYGSSKSVIALCTKILRVHPRRTDVFLRLVHLMIEREHLADARVVLTEYAGRMKLPKAGFVLEDLADRPEQQLKPVLEMLLELGGRYEYARAQGKGQPTAAKKVEEERESEKDSTAEEPADTTEPSTEGVEGSPTAEGLQPEHTPQAEDEDVERLFGESEPKDEPEQASEKTPTLAARVSAESDVQRVGERPSMRISGLRDSRKVLFSQVKSRKKQKAVWIGLGVAAVVVVGGLSLVLFNVIPLGGGGAGAGGASPEPTSVPAPSDSVPVAGVDLEDTTSTEGDRSASPAADTAAAEITDSRAADRDSVTIGAVDSTGLAATESDTAGSETAAGDTSQATQREVPEETPVARTSAEFSSGRGVLVQGFRVESTAEFAVDGKVGYRVTQVLNSGERLTLTTVYYGGNIAAAPWTEEITLSSLVGDTSTATMQFNGYAVEARAVVSASVLELLLGRLTEVRPSN